MFLKRYLNIQEIVFDLFIAVIAGYMYKYLVQDAGTFISSLSHTTAQYVVLIIEFAVSYFLGKLGSSFLRDTADTAKGRVPVSAILYGITGIYILFIVYISLPPLLNASGFLTYLFGLLVIVFGALAGIATWLDDTENTAEQNTMQNNSGTSENPDSPETGSSGNTGKIRRFLRWVSRRTESVSYKKHPIIIIIPVVTLLYTIIVFVMAFSGTSGFAGILVFIGSIVAGILALYISGFICHFILALYGAMKQNYPFAHNIIIHILYPAIMAFFIMTWNNLYLYAGMHGAGHSGPLYIIAALTFTGIIPIRIFMALEPPVRYANIAISIAAFTLFIVSVLSYQ